MEPTVINHNVQYPHMRLQLISCLSSLSDYNYQKQGWLGKQFPSSIIYDDFTMNVHCLLDDLDLINDHESYIGIVFINKQEAEASYNVALIIENILKKYGSDLSDESYMNVPEWQGMIDLAKYAKELLDKNDAADTSEN